MRKHNININLLIYIILILFFPILGLQALFSNVLLSDSQDSIYREGLVLYNLKTASVKSTSILNELKTNIEIGGYVSYLDGQYTRTIFYNANYPDSIVVTISFPWIKADNDAYLIDSVSRPATEKEKIFVTLKTKALDEIKFNRINIFSIEKGITFDILPLNASYPYKVYIVPDYNNTNEMIFGYDYLLVYDSLMNLKSNNNLHDKITHIPSSGIKPDVITSHQHNNSDMITSTDVYRLLLYGRYTNWITHFVISDKFISIWNVKTERLMIISRDLWEKMGVDTRDLEK